MDETTLAVAGLLAALNFTGWSIWLATRKNRDWREGLAMGVMLGPLGVIVAALMPALEYVPVDEPKRSAGPSSVDARGIVGVKSAARAPLTKPCSDAEWEKLAQDEATSEAPPVKRFTDAEWAKRTAPNGTGRKPLAK